MATVHEPIVPPGVKSLIDHIANNNMAELGEYCEEAAGIYQRLQARPANELDDYGIAMAAGVAWDTIRAIQQVCGLFWLSEGGHLTVTQCFDRLARMARAAAEANPLVPRTLVGIR